MNTLNSRYAQHMKDIYGIETAMIPQIERGELSTLASLITTYIQPLLLRDYLNVRFD